MEGIITGLKELKKSDIYQNYETNKKLYEGKSIDVFYKDVLRRVKLEYMGLLDDRNNYREFFLDGNKIKWKSKKFDNLIVGNNILGAVTKLFVELAANKPPTLGIDEDKREFLELIDFQDELSEAIAIQSYAGRLLIRGTMINNKLSFFIVPPVNYFKIPNLLNPDMAEAYVFFEEDSKNNTLKCEIYREDKTEYRLFTITKDVIEEIQYPENLEKYGMKVDGKGYVDNYKGWQVAEVDNISRQTDYLPDLVVINRELLIGDTLTSQAFDKVANPLLQVPESMLETDPDTGDYYINLKDRTAIVGDGDKELKQVSLETKTAEWKIQRDNYLYQIYQATGTNEQAFGIDKNGAASGESKIRSMERTLAAVETKRNKIIRAYEKIVKWGYAYLKKDGELDFTLQCKEIISLSATEKVNIANTAIVAGMMSLEAAVEYINLTEITTEEEVKRIKGDLAYRTKLLELLERLRQIDTEGKLDKSIQEQVDSLIEEFGLNEDDE